MFQDKNAGWQLWTSNQKLFLAPFKTNLFWVYDFKCSKKNLFVEIVFSKQKPLQIWSTFYIKILCQISCFGNKRCVLWKLTFPNKETSCSMSSNAALCLSMRPSVSLFTSTKVLARPAELGSKDTGATTSGNAATTSSSLYIICPFTLFCWATLLYLTIIEKKLWWKLC